MSANPDSIFSFASIFDHKTYIAEEIANGKSEDEIYEHLIE